MSTSILFRAGWVLPVTSPPLRDGGILVEDGRIRETGPIADLERLYPRAEGVDLGSVVALPGLVNAHTHLSLDSMRGLLPSPTPYLDALGEITARAAGLTEREVESAVRAGIEESWRRGTSAVGEITTRPEGTSALAADGRILARVYFEFLGVTRERAARRFAAARDQVREWTDARVAPPWIRVGLSPHAPYSVWPGLWEDTASFCRTRGLRWSTHLAESPFEDAFLRDGTGPLRDYLESLGVWNGSFPVPGRSILDAWEDAGVLDSRSLLVHGVHLTPGDVPRIAVRNASLCLCPRSNAHLDLPPAPAEELHAARVNLCLGTDSLATNEDLAVWGEMRALFRQAPRIPPSTLLTFATWNGAFALGLEDEVGSLGRGRRADFLAVPATPLPADPFRFLLQDGAEEGFVRPFEAIAPPSSPG